MHIHKHTRAHSMLDSAAITADQIHIVLKLKTYCYYKLNQPDVEEYGLSNHVTTEVLDQVRRHGERVGVERPDEVVAGGRGRTPTRETNDVAVAAGQCYRRLAASNVQPPPQQGFPVGAVRSHEALVVISYERVKRDLVRLQQ